MSKKFNNVEEIVAARMCLGCGVCASACKPGAIELRDVEGEGIRPFYTSAEAKANCTEGVKVCPGIETDFRGEGNTEMWGPVLEIWEGHATDPEIRFQGSSGGALTAIGLYCVEKGDMAGVLHVGQDPDTVVHNRTRLSKNRDQLMNACGSRYAPAAVGDGLGLVENAGAPCAIVGKPAEVSGIRKAMALRPELEKKVGVIMSFFCAETPSTKGTRALIKHLGEDEDELERVWYRGKGWPGHFTPVLKGGAESKNTMPYRDAWKFLTSYRPWSTHLWPDGGGELADISCGDPWYEKPDGKNPGFSIVVVRTERGREIIKGAMDAGYLSMTKAESWKLDKSQGSLSTKKGEVWGRRLGMKLCGLPVAEFPGAQMFHCWMKLSNGRKMRSVLGSLKRIVSRKLGKPFVPVRDEARPVGEPIDC